MGIVYKKAHNDFKKKLKAASIKNLHALGCSMSFLDNGYDHTASRYFQNGGLANTKINQESIHQSGNRSRKKPKIKHSICIVIIYKSIKVLIKYKNLTNFMQPQSVLISCTTDKQCNESEEEFSKEYKTKRKHTKSISVEKKA